MCFLGNKYRFLHIIQTIFVQGMVKQISIFCMENEAGRKFCGCVSVRMDISVTSGF
jgi:hypothetical protein